MPVSPNQQLQRRLLGERRLRLVPESQRFEEVPNREEDATEEHSFDELARGLASGAISRRKALKLGGVALLGGFGLFSVFPDAAEARRRDRKSTRLNSSHANISYA